VLTWNLPTRLLHWLIALPVLLNFFIEGGDLAHKILGYVAAAALIFRIFWGFKTTDQGNFKQFPLSLGELKKWRSPIYQGHNPLASWVYIMIWTLVGLLGISGFMMSLDAFWGAQWLEDLHDKLSTALKLLVLMHLLGLILDSYKHKRKTWLGMISGKK
jgi:cytochrome b